jgi:hypothetical protein
MSQKIAGSDRVLPNKATGAYFKVTKADGSQGKVFRIYKSSKAIAANATTYKRAPKAITKAQAQNAFDRYYDRTHTVKRGPRKGSPRYASPTGRRSAGTYDRDHRMPTRAGRPSPVIADTRYLNNPGRWDFQGVDTGSKKRKPLSAAQKAALVKGRAALRAKRQAGGFWR